MSRESARIKRRVDTNLAILLPSNDSGCVPLGNVFLMFGNLRPQFKKRPRANAGGLCFVGGSHAYNRSTCLIAVKAARTTPEWWTVGQFGPVNPRVSVMSFNLLSVRPVRPQICQLRPHNRRPTVKVRLATSTNSVYGTTAPISGQGREGRISVAQYIPKLNHVRGRNDWSRQRETGRCGSCTAEVVIWPISSRRVV